MNNKGFISLIGIVIILIVSIIMVFVLSTIVDDRELICDRNNKNYSFYEAENKLYLSLYDGFYFDKYILPTLKSSIVNNRYYGLHRFNFKSEDMYLDDNKLEFSFKYDCINKEDIYPDTIIMNTESFINNIRTKKISKVLFVNPLFLKKEIEYDDKIRLQEELFYNLNNMEENKLDVKDFYKNENINSKRNFIEYDNMDLILRDEYSIEALENREVSLFYKTDDSVLNIGRIKNNKKPIKLEGIIYINGDINLNTDFHFNGIIILRNGRIINNKNRNFNCRGLIIGDEDIEYKYDMIEIYKYGIYLPDFFRMEIKRIEENY